MEKDLTKGAEWKLILLFALPIMAGQLLQQLYNTVDGIVVGNYVSSEALAAVGSCTTIALLFLAIGVGMGNGCAIVISQFFGAKKLTEMRRAASTILILFIGLGIVFTVLGVATSELVMKYLLGITDPDIYSQAVAYFRVYSIGIFFQFMYNAVAALLRAVGDSRATLYFLLISTVANIGLDILFVAAFEWGVIGAAIATVIAQAACMFASCIYMYKRHEHFRFAIKEFVFDKDKLGICLRMGIPTTIQQIFISCGMMFLQRLVNSFGSDTMAAFTVGSRFDQYMSIPSMGFYMAMSAFAGQNTGAGKPERIRRGLFQVIAMNMICVAILGAALYILAPTCAGLFGVTGEAMTQSVEYLRFIVIVYPLLALYLPANGMFQGAGVPQHAMIIVLIALGMRVLSAYVMVYGFGVDHAACWYNCAFGWGIALCYATIIFFSGVWKKKSVVR